MSKISVCIPVYEMHGKGVEMLKRCLLSLQNQKFTDFEVVISDDSENLDIWNLLRNYTESLDILYVKNLNKGMAANTNSAIKSARGELIKILYQDDYLAHKNSLKNIVGNFTENWMITGSSNNPHPYYSHVNTLGSPSCLTIRNHDPLLFDENLKWVLDLEYYKRMYEKWGTPQILDEVNVVIGLGEWQETNHLTLEEKLKEENL